MALEVLVFEHLESTYPPAYCTNVHAGAGFDEMFANLREHVPSVKLHRRSGGPMGIGLWFSDRSVREAQLRPNRTALRRWLEINSVVPFTANAFPQRDFHQPVVKHQVYEPDWASNERLEYTLAVFRIMHELAPSDREISVSTLPLGWPRPHLEDSFYAACARNLVAVCRQLALLEQKRGRLAYLCLEPEPGCLLERADDVIQFFRRWLFDDAAQTELVRRHLRVCHDICHAAVMFESQAAAIARLAEEGIGIGKVQVSAAIEADFASRSAPHRNRLLLALRSFNERRYLHQTNVLRANGEQTFYDDLHEALDRESTRVDSKWHVHFHVPIFLEELGPLRSTSAEIRPCLEGLSRGSSALHLVPRHFEIETYAWNVLPENFVASHLSEGIAAELDWFDAVWRSAGPGVSGIGVE